VTWWKSSLLADVGEVELCSMPFLNNQMVLSPAFAIELRGEDCWKIFNKDKDDEEIGHSRFECQVESCV
jgi:hypothetical protein